MKGAYSLNRYMLLLVSLPVVSVAMLFSMVVPASAATDDWRQVSAPPPPGPYRTINLDPRVPVHAEMPAMGNIARFLQPFRHSQTEARPAVPGSRRRASYPAPTNPASMYQAFGQRTSLEQPAMNPSALDQPPPAVPGAYENRVPVYAYPGPAGYAGQIRAADAGMMPHRGYYPSLPNQFEQDVPPPPVYDAMMQAPPGIYQSGAGR